jgi:hypothetical protein
VLSQTYEIAGLTPEDALDFYVDRLAQEWTLRLGPEIVGLGAEVEAGSPGQVYRAGWSSGDQELLIASRPGDNVQIAVVDVVIGPAGAGILEDA